jgi:hypothetical protein
VLQQQQLQQLLLQEQAPVLASPLMVLLVQAPLRLLLQLLALLL